MKSINKSSEGFTLLEVSLLLLILLLLGVSGYYIYHKSNKTSSTLNENPYTGWKSYRLSDEKVTFKYPSSWTLSKAYYGNTQDSTFNIFDGVYIKAPDGFEIDMVTTSSKRDGNESTILYSEPITFVGQSDYLNFVSNGRINTAYLSTSSSNSNDSPEARNNLTTKYSKGHTTYFSVYMILPTGQQTIRSLNEAKNNKDITNAKLLLESFSY